MPISLVVHILTDAEGNDNLGIANLRVEYAEGNDNRRVRGEQ
jgi:hypothetical protein